ncbi:MAG: hypothetical protein WA726_06630 [Acidimicrobiia bacterium]
MTIAIHRGRQQQTMIGIGLVAVLTVATVVALRLDSRPITVADDPAPAVQSGSVDSVQGATTAQSLRDVEVHQKWLESVRNGAIWSEQMDTTESASPAFTVTAAGDLIPGPIVRPFTWGESLPATVAAQPAGAGNGFGALPAR